MLSGEAIKEFKKLYKEELNLEISDEKAIELGTALMRLVKVVYGPNLPKKWIYKDKRTHK